MDTKIVSAGAKTVKVDESVDRSGAKIGERLPASPRGHPRKHGFDRGTQTGLQVAPPNRHAGQLAFNRCRYDLHRDRRILRLHQPHGRIGHADGDHIADSRVAPGDLHRLGRSSRQLLEPALGSGHFDGRRFRCHAADYVAGRRFAIERGNDGNGAASRLLEIHGNRPGHDLCDLDAIRRAHFIAAEMKHS